MKKNIIVGLIFGLGLYNENKIRSRKALKNKTRSNVDDNELDWNDIDESRRNNWEILGYNNKNWEKRVKFRYSKIEKKRWDNLTNIEQEAALNLGFTEELWIFYLKDWDTKWDELGESRRNNWEILGYNKAKWLKKNGPIYYYTKIELKRWNKLTNIEQEAALNLGYTEEDWYNSSKKQYKLDTR